MKCINCKKEMVEIPKNKLLIPPIIKFECECNWVYWSDSKLWYNGDGIEISPVEDILTKREEYPKVIITLDGAIENLKTTWAKLMFPIKKAWNEGMKNLNAAMEELKKKLGEDNE